MMTDNDVLAQLDWQTVLCQCEVHHCPHGRRPCRSLAIRQVEFHAIDRCNDPTLGEFGNYLALLCVPCLMSLATNVEAHIKRLNQFGQAICLTCGAPVSQIDHVIREITELK